MGGGVCNREREGELMNVQTLNDSSSSRPIFALIHIFKRPAPESNLMIPNELGWEKIRKNVSVFHAEKKKGSSDRRARHTHEELLGVFRLW
jgi:hypothetical protein